MTIDIRGMFLIIFFGSPDGHRAKTKKTPLKDETWPHIPSELAVCFRASSGGPGALRDEDGVLHPVLADYLAFVDWVGQHIRDLIT